jgi:hypothetical protein
MHHEPQPAGGGADAEGQLGQHLVGSFEAIGDYVVLGQLAGELPNALAARNRLNPHSAETLQVSPGEPHLPMMPTLLTEGRALM